MPATLAIETYNGGVRAAGGLTTDLEADINGVVISTAGAITGVTTLDTSAVSSTGTLTARSGTAVPATAGAVAAGVPVQLFSNGPAIYVTSDAPTFTAVKGSLCINTSGSSTSTRLYVNNGTTNWVAITTAS